MAKSNTIFSYPPLEFELPASLLAEKLIAQLQAYVEIQPLTRQHIIKTYYDSFDWRLYSNDIICDFTRSKTASTLTLSGLGDGRIIASAEQEDIPAFSKQFQAPAIRRILEPILEMRALLSLCRLEYDAYALNILNHDKKTVVRLLIQAHQQINSRVSVQPIKGYDKNAEHIIDLLTTKLGLTPADNSLLISALKLLGHKPKDYSSKLNINLDPNMRADIASKYIYSHLLKTIKDNEQGVINDTDSEFLHDFRVAVRRTRAGLSQIKGVLPEPITAYYADFFSWLGQITSPTRDLDVYLLNFEDYKNSLPVTIREDLNPLHDFLVFKQQKSQQELAKKLQSSKFSSTMAEWEHCLKAEAPQKPLAVHANLTIKQLADLRIWKVFNRVLQEGDAISGESKPETLHDLRKTCKKLRYLMEFFQNIYPDSAIKPLIKYLKELQDVLGDFQDYQTQEHQLKLFSEEMAVYQLPANTLLAIDALIQNLDINKCRARNNFSEKYAAFKQNENQAAFKKLFAK
ncbi:MAG: CHAD domain-containing protein [Methylovulum sp.]|nr:CHAD domain-containing protein [Methylovulum sp.]